MIVVESKARPGELGWVRFRAQVIGHASDMDTAGLDTVSAVLRRGGRAKIWFDLTPQPVSVQDAEREAGALRQRLVDRGTGPITVKVRPWDDFCGDCITGAEKSSGYLVTMKPEARA